MLNDDDKLSTDTSGLTVLRFQTTAPLQISHHVLYTRMLEKLMSLSIL